MIRPRASGLFTGLALAACFLPSAESADPARRSPAPRIACDAPMLDLGRRPPGSERITHAFILRNDGDVSLEIGSIRQYCGCTGVRIGRRTLAPGEETELLATFSLAGRRGTVNQSIHVHSNDPVQPEFQLTFAAVIEPEVAFHPMSFLLGRVGRNAEASGTVDATFPADRPGRILSAAADSPFFETQVEELEPGQRYRIHLRTRPPLDGPSASLRATVRVRTDLPQAPEWRLPIAATRVEEVMTAPDVIDLVAGEQDAVVRFVSLQTASRDGRLRVLSVEAPPRVQATVEESGPRSLRIRLEWDGPRAELDGQVLRIRTDRAGYEVIEIPFRVRYDRRSAFPVLAGPHPLA